MTATSATLTAQDEGGHRLLVRYMLLSLGAAVATILLKVLAAAITGSVGFLSDAMESGVNLVAAVVALLALRTAARPPDAEHEFGHGKAEYLSAAVEGTLVFVAATAIVWTSVQRLLDPAPLEQAGLGLALSTGASALNLAVGIALVRAGRTHRSITLLADGKHLLTDVWTSGGVLVGIALVAIFDWEMLDPIVALLVGVNILRTGYSLVKRSLNGLLDAALPADDLASIQGVLDRYRECELVRIHSPRSREAGRQRFIYLNLAVPGDWTVQQGHDLSERLERDIARELDDTTVFTHIETHEPSDPNCPILEKRCWDQRRTVAVHHPQSAVPGAGTPASTGTAAAARPGHACAPESAFGSLAHSAPAGRRDRTSATPCCGIGGYGRLGKPTVESARVTGASGTAWLDRGAVYDRVVNPVIDIVADLNAQGDDGLGWATLGEAVDASKVRPGATLVAGNQQARATVRVVAVDCDGQVHFEIL